MNRSVMLLLRRPARQLDLIDSMMNDVGKRSLVTASHPFRNQVNLHPVRLSPNTIPSVCSSPTSWVVVNKPPRFQKLASRVEAQPPEMPDARNAQPHSGKGDRPPLEKQLIVYNTLRDGLPKLFTHTMDYRIYNKELVFINNLVGKTTKGLPAYIQQVSFLRTVGHFKFAFVRFEILNMSHDVEAARVTVRWRIIGVSGLKVIFKFWKYKLWKREELQKQAQQWYDGISYFDIGSDGLVWRHIADKLEEDKDRLVTKSKTPLAAKLALLAVALKPVTGEPSSQLFFSIFH